MDATADLTTVRAPRAAPGTDAGHGERDLRPARRRSADGPPLRRLAAGARCPDRRATGSRWRLSRAARLSTPTADAGQRGGLRRLGRAARRPPAAARGGGGGDRSGARQGAARLAGRLFDVDWRRSTRASRLHPPGDRVPRSGASRRSFSPTRSAGIDASGPGTSPTPASNPTGSCLRGVSSSTRAAGTWPRSIMIATQSASSAPTVVVTSRSSTATTFKAPPGFDAVAEVSGSFARIPRDWTVELTLDLPFETATARHTGGTRRAHRRAGRNPPTGTGRLARLARDDHRRSRLRLHDRRAHRASRASPTRSRSDSNGARERSSSAGDRCWSTERTRSFNTAGVNGF